MIITCDNCDTSFELEDNLVKEGGSKVRCTNCDHVFIAHPQENSGDSDALDLSELDFQLEMEDMGFSDDEPQTEETEPDLFLELEDEIPKDSPEDDALDLTDIENMLEMTDNEKPPAIHEEEDLELQLELVDEAASTDLEPMEEDPEEDPDDLDFSDIEKLLEMDEAQILAEGAVADENEPELVLEMASDLEFAIADKAGTGSDELDLSDIEKLLEIEDLKSPEHRDEEEELKLDLDLETDADRELEELSQEKDDKDLEDLGLEFGDSDDLALEMDEDNSAVIQSSDKEDFELDFDFEEPDPEGSVIEISISDEADEPEEIKSGSFGMGVEKEPEVPLKPAAPAKSKTKQPFTTSLPLPKKSLKAPVMLVLLLLILAGGAVGGYYYGVEKGIKIPFMGSPGEIIPLEDTFKHAFVDNNKIGSLFVITGFVENKFNAGRSNIQVAGELLTSDAKVVKKQTVYCGNTINATELATADGEMIKKHLEKSAGDNNSNVNVKPGIKLPFMLVFSDLPDNMAEYRIQIIGSSPVDK